MLSTYQVVAACWLTVAMALIAPWTAAVGKDAIQSANVVRIDVVNDDGITVSSGFGLTTANVDAVLTIATANHIVRGHDSTPLGRIQIRFSAFPNFVGEATLIDRFSRNYDIAALTVEAPADYVFDEFMLDSSELSAGEKAWALEPARWSAPEIPGAFRFKREGRLWFQGLGVLPGSSGGPVVTRRGVVGLVISDQDPNNTIAISIKDVATMFQPENSNLPWQLREWDFDQANELAMLSESLRHANPAQALKLAIAAWPRTADDGYPRTAAALTAVREALQPATRDAASVLKPEQNWVSIARFTPQGNHILTYSPGNGAVWDARRGRLITGIFSHPGAVSSATFSPSGDFILTAGQGGQVRLTSFTPGSEYALEFATDGNWVYSADFSPDGSRIAAAGSKTAHVWDAKTGDPLVELGPLECCGIKKIAFVDAGRQIVTVSGPPHGSVVLWDASTGAEVATLIQNQPLAFSTAAVSDDKTKLITGSTEGAAQLWDLSSRVKIAELNGHEERVFTATFSPDNTLAVTASDDFTARVWSSDTGAEIVVLDHSAEVKSVTFSPAGDRLVTGTDDGTVLVWDTASWANLLVLQGHTAGVTSLSFSPDGNRIVSASKDKTARIWDLADIAQLSVFQFACRQLPDFSLAEIQVQYDLIIDRPICVKDPPRP